MGKFCGPGRSLKPVNIEASTSLIAIMLGRLGMSIGQCIEAYDTLAAKAFKEKSGLKLPGSPSGSFSATALKEALITAIEKNCNESGSGALFRNHQCCKT